MKYLYALGGIVVAIFTALFSGMQAGKAKEREKQAEKAAGQARRANEIDEEVHHRGAAAARQRLRRNARK